MEWQLAEAKNKFSEVVNLALSGEPQKVTRRNDAVVILSAQEYHLLTGQKLSFKELLLRPPPDIMDISLVRDKSAMRDIDL